MTRYLITQVDGGGSVPPELGLARRLVERGHHVTVLTEDSAKAEVAASGAEFRPWTRAPNRPDSSPEHDPSRDWECRNPLQLVDRLIRTRLVGPAQSYVEDTAEAIADSRPDLVLCSMLCFGGMMAAEAAGIPFDVLVPNIYLLPAKGLPPFGMGLRPATGGAGRVRDQLINSVTQRLWDARGRAATNELRSRHGLPPLAHMWDQVHRARRELVLTSPDFDFPAAFPANVRYVGPVLDDPAWAAADTWQPPAGDEPLVLVALSSTFQDQLDCLRRIVEAVGTLPVRAVVTTGLAIDPAELPAPANVTVVASAPHRLVLEHAALVITHGGHGTVLKALAADVPVVVLHHGRDQADNAARISARGVGVAVKRTAPPARIATAVRRVLADPSYRAGASRLGESIRRDAASDAAVRELESIQDR